MANIVDTATNAGTFNTLVSAVKAAGLTDTLANSGPYTVFAPNDEAFAKVDPGTLETLMSPEGRPKLVEILTYHVVQRKYMAKDVLGLTSIRTVQGSQVPVDTTDGVKIGDATVIAPDIQADNGVIHVIDTVLIPA